MLRHLTILVVLLAPLPAIAEQAASCTALFVGGQAPRLLNARLADRTHPLCYRAFAVLASGMTRGALWSAEHLTAATVTNARTTPRVDVFQPDDNLRAADRAELDDYARSGFDRGHMTPSGDMPDGDAQAESFSLANMVPQTPELNRGLWARIESAVRGLARRRGEVYVVTGPAFQGSNLQQVNGRVLVPSSTWKAVYVPRTREVGAYSCTNIARPSCQILSVATLAGQVGIDPFPGVPDGTKAVVARLPLPRPPRQRSTTP